MSKIALICDSHFGVRGDNQLFYNYFEKFYNNVFFPYLDEHKIDTVIHLGDLVDRRKYINFQTSQKLNDIFMQPMFDRNIDFHIIVGNHDVSYKDSNKLNAISELYGNSKYEFNLYEDPVTVNIHGVDICMLPWINNSKASQDDSFAEINSTKAQILMGHLELAGFELHRGHIAEHGMDKNLFMKFDAVYSGHYHHKSSHDNIHYLGSPGQFTWTDYDDDKGFHVLDTVTREIEFIKNPYQLFKKYFYNDLNRTREEILNFDASQFEGTYTKVVVKNKTDPFIFDLLVSKIEKAGVNDLQVVEDHLNFDTIDDLDLIDEAEDTITIIKKYIASINTSLNTAKIEATMLELYTEALNIE